MTKMDSHGINYRKISDIFSFIVIFLIAVLLTFMVVLFKNGTALKIVYFNASAQVINVSKMNITKIGVSVDPNKLQFGIVPLGGNVTREVEIKVPLSFSTDVIVLLYPEGNITQWLKIKDREVVLAPSSSRSIPVKFIGIKEGTYTGKLYTLMCFPRYAIARRFIDVLCRERFERWIEEHKKIYPPQ